MRRLLLLSLVAVMAAASPSSADVLFDNFGPGDTFSTTSGHTIGGFLDQWKAVALTVPPGEPVMLVSMTVAIFQNIGGAPGAWGFVKGAVFADEFGLPSRYPLESADFPSTMTGNRVVTIPFSGTTVLLPGETYWFALNNVTTEEFFWRRATPVVLTLPFAAMFGDAGEWGLMSSTSIKDPAIRVEVAAEGPIATENGSWGSVKALFR